MIDISRIISFFILLYLLIMPCNIKHISLWVYIALVAIAICVQLYDKTLGVMFVCCIIALWIHVQRNASP